MLLIPEKDAKSCIEHEKDDKNNKMIFERLHEESKQNEEKRKDLSKLRIEEDL